MAKWKVTVTETITKYINVEADSYEDAIDEAEQASDDEFYGHEWGTPEASDARKTK